jgi:hypothetical protein
MTDAPRHFCRHLRCRSKLTQPVENEHHAFCTESCFEQFYRKRCLACEELLRTSRRAFCPQPAKCANLVRTWPQKYRWPGHPTGHCRVGPGNADKMGVKNGPRKRPTSLPETRASRHLDWTWQGGDDEHRLLDRNGNLRARIEADIGTRWRLTHPATTPLMTAENIAAANRLALSMALAALPVDQTTTKGTRINAPPVARTTTPATFDFHITESKVGGDPGPIPEFLRRDLQTKRTA